MTTSTAGGARRQGDTNMTFGEYVAAYEALLKALLSYTPAQVGCEVYASKMADLEEAHPDHAAQYDAQF